MLFRDTITQNLVLSVRILGEEGRWPGVTASGNEQNRKLFCLLINKIGFEPCGARSGERRVRWALEATQEGGGNCSLGNVCATGERSIRAHHHPRVEAERSGRLSPVPRTGSASGVWKD